jgi:hypothetical protein
VAECSGNSVHEIVAKGGRWWGLLRDSPHENMWCGALRDTPAGHLGPISLHYVSWRRSLHRRWMHDRTVSGLCRPPWVLGSTCGPSVSMSKSPIGCLWRELNLQLLEHRGYISSTYHTPLGGVGLCRRPPLLRSVGPLPLLRGCLHHGP